MKLKQQQTIILPEKGGVEVPLALPLALQKTVPTIVVTLTLMTRASANEAASKAHTTKTSNTFKPIFSKANTTLFY